MAAHLRPRESKARPAGALTFAAAAAVAVLVALEGRSDDAPTRVARPATAVSTAPTVLAEVIESTTSLPDASPAAPATFVLADPAPADPPGPDRVDRTAPTLAPPVSVTSPAPPRTTTTTRPTTTTSSSTTTSEPGSSTTEAPPGDA